MAVLAVLALIALIIGVWKFFQKPKNFPPGPSLIPIRSLLRIFLNKSTFQGFQQILEEWGKEYGGVIGLSCGPLRIVFLQGFPTVWDGLRHPGFSHRPKHQWPVVMSRGEYGFAYTQPKASKELKNFAVKALSEEFRRERADSRILSNVEILLAQLNRNESLEVRGLFYPLAILTAWDILASHTSYDHKDVVKITLEMALGYIGILNRVALAFPKLSELFPEWSGVAGFRRALKPMHAMLEDVIAEHKSTLDVNNPRDFIDAFLVEASKSTDPNSCFYGEIGQKHLFATVVDLLFTAGPTINSSLEWLILYITKFPEVQTRLQMEIQNIIGPSRQPSQMDMENMPYTMALIYEVFRKTSGIPFLAIRYSTEATVFKGFDIPASTHVFPNILGVNQSEDIWKDPEAFRLERFLNADESKFVKVPEIMPFGAGERSCPSERYSKIVVFLTIASIYQKFRTVFDLSSKDTPIQKEDTKYFIYPNEFKINVIEV